MPMFKDKTFTPLIRKVACDHCGHEINVFNALKYKNKHYCCHLCKGHAEFRDRVK